MGWEGFGNVLVEALTAGTPVVSCNCPGGPKTILNNGKYGILVEPENPEALAKGILDVLKSNTTFDKKELIARGLQYSVATIAEKYLEVIKGDQPPCRSLDKLK